MKRMNNDPLPTIDSADTEKKVPGIKIIVTGFDDILLHVTDPKFKSADRNDMPLKLPELIEPCLYYANTKGISIVITTPRPETDRDIQQYCVYMKEKYDIKLSVIFDSTINHERITKFMAARYKNIVPPGLQSNQESFELWYSERNFAIFKAMEDQGLNPLLAEDRAKVLYLDHVEENIEKAQKVGIRTIKVVEPNVKPNPSEQLDPRSSFSYAVRLADNLGMLSSSVVEGKGKNDLHAAITDFSAGITFTTLKIPAKLLYVNDEMLRLAREYKQPSLKKAFLEVGQAAGALVFKRKATQKHLAARDSVEKQFEPVSESEEETSAKSTPQLPVPTYQATHTSYFQPQPETGTTAACVYIGLYGFFFISLLMMLGANVIKDFASVDYQENLSEQNSFYYAIANSVELTLVILFGIYLAITDAKNNQKGENAPLKDSKSISPSYGGVDRV